MFAETFFPSIAVIFITNLNPMINQRPVDAIIKFITSFPTPEEVLAYRPSSESQERLTQLLDEQSTRELTIDEHRELDYFMVVEHIMRMARLEAKERLAA